MKLEVKYNSGKIEHVDVIKFAKYLNAKPEVDVEFTPWDIIDYYENLNDVESIERIYKHKKIV